MKILHTVAEDFLYLGAGVRLGQTDRIVCWFRPRTGENYRVLFGDLSAKEMAEDELPLKLPR